MRAGCPLRERGGLGSRSLTSVGGSGCGLDKNGEKADTEGRWGSAVEVGLAGRNWELGIGNWFICDIISVVNLIRICIDNISKKGYSYLRKGKNIVRLALYDRSNVLE